MSCCIVLLADGGKSAVMASDNIKCQRIDGKYVSDGDGSIKKIHRLNEHVYLMYAGDSGQCPLIANSSGIKAEDTVSSAADRMSKTVASELATQRGYILAGENLDWEQYRQPRDNWTAEAKVSLDQRLFSFQFDCDWVVVGYDEKIEDGISIKHIDGMHGNNYNRTFLGIFIVGIGTSLATTKINEMKYNKNMPLDEVTDIIKLAMAEASKHEMVGELNQLITIPETT